MKRYALCFALTASLASPADLPTLRGYSTDSSKTEHDWEAKFRAIPDAGNMREFMQRLSARPHHVGSPYDKDNAEWILAKFKEWGLDAHIETFDVLFPTPEERVLELVEPTHFTAKLEEPTVAGRSHFRPARRATAEPTTPTPSMATSPRRWSTSTTASPRITKSSTGWASPSRARS